MNESVNTIKSSLELIKKDSYFVREFKDNNVEITEGQNCVVFEVNSSFNKTENIFRIIFLLSEDTEIKNILFEYDTNLTDPKTFSNVLYFQSVLYTLFKKDYHKIKIN